LRPLFDLVAHFFELAQIHAQHEIEYLKPIEKKFTRALVVYPGTAEAYSSWEPMHKQWLEICHAGLENALNMSTASVEFLWRCWEIGLELGAEPEQPETIDPDRVLQFLVQRAKVLGHPELLLAECTLNRYCMPRSGAGSYATDSEIAAALIAAIRGDKPTEQEAAAERAESLSFFFFDQILQKYTQPLRRDYVPTLAELLERHEVPLRRMRDKCHDEAMQLLAHPPDERLLQKVILRSLRSMTDEAAAIADSDSRAIKSYFAALSQNPTIWGTVGGVLGSLAVMPPAVTASFAVAAFSVLGASAVKAQGEKNAAIRQSSFSFVYYATRNK
jgi:hypothetical protein